MGLSHSKPPAKDYTQLLEKLEDEIVYFERSEQQLRRRAWRVEVGFVLFVLVSYAVLVYVGVLSQTGQFDLRWLFVIFFGYPAVLYVVRRLLSIYFERRLGHCAARLVALRSQRTEVIDEVKDKQSYNVAKQLLDRFETPNPKSRSADSDAPPTPPSSAIQACAQSAPIPPRPIPPYHRGFWDKIVDVILRDGPSNRYALVCLYCKGHNGMAMAEEFDDLTFRCCYCSMLNPSARQMRVRYRATSINTHAHEPPHQDSSHSDASCSN